MFMELHSSSICAMHMHKHFPYACNNNYVNIRWFNMFCSLKARGGSIRGHQIMHIFSDIHHRTSQCGFGFYGVIKPPAEDTRITAFDGRLTCVCLCALLLSDIALYAFRFTLLVSLRIKSTRVIIPNRFLISPLTII